MARPAAIACLGLAWFAWHTARAHSDASQAAHGETAALGVDTCNTNGEEFPRVQAQILEEGFRPWPGVELSHDKDGSSTVRFVGVVLPVLVDSLWVPLAERKVSDMHWTLEGLTRDTGRNGNPVQFDTTAKSNGNGEECHLWDTIHRQYISVDPKYVWAGDFHMLHLRVKLVTKTQLLNGMTGTVVFPSKNQPNRALSVKLDPVVIPGVWNARKMSALETVEHTKMSTSLGGSMVYKVRHTQVEEPQEHKVDIGVFGHHRGEPGAELLCGERPPPPAAARASAAEVLAVLGAQGHAGFAAWQQHGSVLDAEGCRRLVQIAGDAHAAAGAVDSDFQLSLAPADLAAAVGPPAAARLQALFGDRVDNITLRRVEARGQCINFHLDNSLRTLQVHLNQEGEYAGGRTAFLTERGLEVPARPQGWALVHSNRVAHGVTRLTGGVRYSLFLLKKTDEAVGGLDFGPAPRGSDASLAPAGAAGGKPPEAEWAVGPWGDAGVRDVVNDTHQQHEALPSQAGAGLDGPWLGSCAAVGAACVGGGPLGQWRTVADAATPAGTFAVL